MVFVCNFDTCRRKKGRVFIFIGIWLVCECNKNDTLLKLFEFESLAFFKSSAFSPKPPLFGLRRRSVDTWTQLCAVSDKIQAYGLVLQWTAYSHTHASALEAQAK